MALKNAYKIAGLDLPTMADLSEPVPAAPSGYSIGLALYPRPLRRRRPETAIYKALATALSDTSLLISMNLHRQLTAINSIHETKRIGSS